MGLLPLIALVVIVVALGAVFPSRWAGAGTSCSTKFETWAEQSRLRVFGAPLLLAVAINTLAGCTGNGAVVSQFFGTAFFAFIFFALFTTGAKIARVRLDIQMAFMTVFFGCVISLFFVFSR